MKKFISIFLFFSILLPCWALAGTTSLTTYYTSPQAKYNTLKLTPSSSTSCSGQSNGTMYTDASGTLHACVESGTNATFPQQCYTAFCSYQTGGTACTPTCATGIPTQITSDSFSISSNTTVVSAVCCSGVPCTVIPGNCTSNFQCGTSNAGTDNCGGTCSTAVPPGCSNGETCTSPTGGTCTCSTHLCGSNCCTTTQTECCNSGSCTAGCCVPGACTVITGFCNSNIGTDQCGNSCPAAPVGCAAGYTCSGSLPTGGNCTPNPCAASSDPGRFVNNIPGVASGSNSTSTCMGGYTGSPSPVYSCSLGTFTYSSGTCAPNPCAASSDPGRFVNNIPGVASGSNSTGACMGGYTGSPSPVYSCSLGSFTFSHGTCAPNPCAPSSDPANHVSNIPGVASGSNSTGTCAGGYTGSPIYSCSLGTFSHTSGSCSANPCAPSSDPVRFISSIPGVASGSNSTGVCMGGYNGSVTYSCSLGSFSYVIGACSPDSCIASSDPGRFVSNIPGVASGSNSTGNCMGGYTGSPSPVYSCSLGIFTFSSGTCAPNPCAASSDPGRFVNNIPGVASGSNSTSTCIGGYTGSPSPVYSCSLGTFSYSSGTCAPNPCAASSDPGRFVNNIPGVGSGSDSTGSCSPGYNGSVTYLCTLGSFSYVSGSCNPNGCGASSDPGREVNNIPAVGSGSDSTGSCSPGYNGSVTYLCSLGSFSYVSGSCNPNGCAASSDPSNNVSSIPSVASGSDSTGVCATNYVGSVTYLCNLGSFSYVSGSCTYSCTPNCNMCSTAAYDGGCGAGSCAANCAASPGNGCVDTSPGCCGSYIQTYTANPGAGSYPCDYTSCPSGTTTTYGGTDDICFSCNVSSVVSWQQGSGVSTCDTIGASCAVIANGACDPTATCTTACSTSSYTGGCGQLCPANCATSCSGSTCVALNCSSVCSSNGRGWSSTFGAFGSEDYDGCTCYCHIPPIAGGCD